MRQEPVAQQIAGQHPGRLSGDRPSAPRTVLLLQFIAQDLTTQRFDVHHRAGGHPFVLEPGAAIRAALAHRHPLDTVRCRGGHGSAAMTAMTGLRPARPGRGGGRSTGFDRDFGRGRGRPKSSFPGSAFLVAQPVFEPGVLLAQPVNLLLLVQASRTITEPTGVRGTALRMAGIAMLAPSLQPSRPQCRQSGLQPPTVLQPLTNPGNQFGGDIETTAPARLGEGPQEGRVLIAPAAGGTVRADAGLGYLRERAFENRPEDIQRLPELHPEGSVETGA